MAKHKDVVFIVNTDAEGKAEVTAPRPLDGRVVKIEYITDNRLPFDPAVKFEFFGAKKNTPIHVAEAVDDRAKWQPSGVLDNEPIKVIVTGGGKGRSGSFHVVTE